jgi:alkylhydroperoxidase domain protein
VSDLLDALADVGDGSPLRGVRAGRPEATAHAQGSYEALFRPEDLGGVSAAERAAIALRVAELHEEPRLAAHYRDLLPDGPVPDGVRLAAELAHADLLATHPVDARPEHLAALSEAGLTATDVVTVSQVIAYVSFQARVLAGLLLLAGAPSGRGPGARTRMAPVERRFTQEELGWSPWVEPLAPDEPTAEQRQALGPRLNSPYFRLLARDFPVLVERTATDVGIFRSEGGLPRAERELAAAVASRVNGCVYCASVHARFASHFSGRRDDVQRLLDEGVTAAQDERWRTLIDVAAALSQTPSREQPGDLARLRALGLTDLEVLDLVQATAFFAWANRLMLTLGEPVGAEALVRG